MYLPSVYSSKWRESFFMIYYKKLLNNLKYYKEFMGKISEHGRQVRMIYGYRQNIPSRQSKVTYLADRIKIQNGNIRTSFS